MIITKKRMNVRVEFNYIEIIANTFSIPVKQNQLIKENISHIAPVCPIAIAMNENSTFTVSYTENQSRYHQFDIINLGQNIILRRGQHIVGFDAADNCHLYVTIMRATNFRDDIP